MRLKKQALLLIGLALFFFFSESVSADGSNFTVKPVMPENQVGETTGYFDLKVNPLGTQVLEVELTNLSEEETTVEVAVSRATTSDAGSVQYSPSEKKEDNSVMFSFDDLVTYEKEVILAPKSTILYPIQLTMPAEMFDGIVLAGIEFKEKDAQKEADSSKEQLQLVNKYSYEVAIQLNETENDVSAELQLTKAKAGHINYRNAVKATLQNPQPLPLTDLTVTGKVYQEKGNKVLHEQTATGMTVAPNSTFDFGIPWENEAFKSGSYRLELTAKSAEGEWSFTKVFKITSKEAEKLNEEAVELETTRIWPYVLLAIGALLFVGVIVFLVTKYVTQSKTPPKKGSTRKKQTSKKKSKKR